MVQTIEQKIWTNAALFPNKVAIKSGMNFVTYRQLCDYVLSAKNHFELLSFYKKNGAIIIAAGKQMGFMFAYFGAHLAGLTVIPIAVETNPTRFKLIVNTVNPLCVIGFEERNIEYPSLSLKEFEQLERIDSSNFNEFPPLNNIADILFTTGTTGVPKGVQLTHANISAAARNINQFIGNAVDDIELLSLPASHSFGLGRIRCCLTKGATLILLGSFVNVKRIFKIIEKENVTGFTMVPASWNYLRKMSGNQLSQYANQIKYIEMGSAYFSSDEKRELSSLFPNTRVTMHYGLTEASRSAFMEFHEDEAYLDSVGKASPNTDIQIFDEQGNILPFYTDGEICVKGEHVTKGYLNTLNDKTFFGEYFRTGDWGYKNEKGYIYLKSRIKELINVGGMKVSPVEVEEILLTIPGILDCACVAIPDPDNVLGEVVKAFIVKAPCIEIFFEKITEELIGKIEGYKIPVVYALIDEIPRTQNGKIQRVLLHDSDC